MNKTTFKKQNNNTKTKEIDETKTNEMHEVEGLLYWHSCFELFYLHCLCVCVCVCVTSQVVMLLYIVSQLWKIKESEID